jgi:hypothetical protein
MDVSKGAFNNLEMMTPKSRALLAPLSPAEQVKIAPAMIANDGGIRRSVLVDDHLEGHGVHVDKASGEVIY